MHEGDSLESAVGRKSKRVKKTFLRKLLRSLGYSFRESRWHFMAHGTYETVFRKFVGNRKVKQLQSLPFCRRGWRMTWRNKEKKKAGFVPLSPQVPPAEEVEKFGGLDLTGLLILGASEGPQRAFWPVQFPLLLPQLQDRSQKPQAVLCLFPSAIQTFREQIHQCNQSEASIWGSWVSQASPTCMPVHREDSRTQEPLTYLVVGHTPQENYHK